MSCQRGGLTLKKGIYYVYTNNHFIKSLDNPEGKIDLNGPAPSVLELYNTLDTNGYIIDEHGSEFELILSNQSSLTLERTTIPDNFILKKEKPLGVALKDTSTLFPYLNEGNNAPEFKPINTYFIIEINRIGSNRFIKLSDIGENINPLLGLDISSYGSSRKSKSKKSRKSKSKSRKSKSKSKSRKSKSKSKSRKTKSRKH
jgi:hypothetical protein